MKKEKTLISTLLFLFLFAFTSFAGPGETVEIDVAKLKGNKEWVNIMAVNAEKQEADFNELVSTGWLELEDRDDIIYFLNYVTYTKLLDFPVDFFLVQKEPSVWLTTTKSSGEGETFKQYNEDFVDSLQLLGQWDARLNEMAESCKRETDLETLAVLGQMLIDMTTYDIEIADAATILTTGRGRCSASTQLFNNLCDRLGYEVETIKCWLKNRETGEAELDKGHVFSRVKIDGVWHYFDVTNKAFDMTPEFIHKYWHFGDGTRGHWYWTKDKEKNN